jgi:DNA-binding MarR family transcriptional regulator
MSDLETHLGYWLRRVSNPVSAAFARALQARQTSVAEWVALYHIHTRHNMTPGELADLLGMTRGAISKVLDRLESKEWVMRSPMPEDNRVQLLSPTPQGDHILPELAQIADQNDQHFFGCLTAEEQATLRSLMQKLAQAHQWSDVPID